MNLSISNQFRLLPLVCIILAAITRPLMAEELTLAKFDKLIKNNKYLFVFFHYTECAECSRILPIWNSLEKRTLSFMNKKLTIGQVDCNIERDLCSRENIKELPTIKLYFIRHLTQMEFVYDESDYDLATLENFLRTKILIIEKNTADDDEDSADEEDELKKDKLFPVNGLYELTDDNIELFLNEGEHFVNFYAPWCKYCKTLEPHWETLAVTMESSDMVKISRVNCVTNTYACQLYKIMDYPSLLWISNGKIVARYKQNDANWSYEQMLQFIYSQVTAFSLRKFAKSPLDEDFIQSNNEKDVKQVNSKVPIEISLNGVNFVSEISSGYSFVLFYVPWSKLCQDLKPEWRKLASQVSQLKDLNVLIATVDCSKNERLCDKEGINGYPTIHLYNKGVFLHEYIELRTVDLFVEYLKASVPFAAKDEL